MCDILTHNDKGDARYRWFYFTQKYWDLLTTEEKNLVVCDKLDDGYLRLWYPKNEKPLDKKSIVKQLNLAMIKEDWDEVAKLRQQLKLCTESISDKSNP